MADDGPDRSAPVVVRWAAAFGRFWWDFLIGDTPEEGARAVQAAARVRPDRLVVGAFSGPAAAELVDAMGDGVDVNELMVRPVGQAI